MGGRKYPGTDQKPKPNVLLLSLLWPQQAPKCTGCSSKHFQLLMACGPWQGCAYLSCTSCRRSRMTASTRPILALCSRHGLENGTQFARLRRLLTTD